MKRYWTWEDAITKGWGLRLKLGRFGAGGRLMRHRSHLGDRWVLQPNFIYDRKRRAVV